MQKLQVAAEVPPSESEVPAAPSDPSSCHVFFFLFFFLLACIAHMVILCHVLSVEQQQVHEWFANGLHARAFHRAYPALQVEAGVSVRSMQTD